jgi:hypothetical protein
MLRAATPAAALTMADDDHVSTGSRTRIRELDDLPLPAWDLVPLDKYLDNGLGYGVIAAAACR